MTYNPTAKLSYADLINKMIGVMQQDTQFQKRLYMEVEDLKEIVTGFKKFFNTDDGEDNRIPYPYRMKHQNTFNDFSGKISSALELVEQVVSDMKKRMFELERNQSSEGAFNMQMNESQPQIAMPNEQKPKFLERITGVKRKKIVNKNDPYQSSIPFFKRANHLIEYWDIFMDWHAEGIDFDEDEFNKYGYITFLKNHRSMFTKEIESDLLRIYKQGLTLQRFMEKYTFAGVLQKSLSELRQQEQNQQQQR